MLPCWEFKYRVCYHGIVGYDSIIRNRLNCTCSLLISTNTLVCLHKICFKFLFIIPPSCLAIYISFLYLIICVLKIRNPQLHGGVLFFACLFDTAVVNFHYLASPDKNCYIHFLHNHFS